MNFELMEALRVIEREKGINFEILLEALANALVTAYKRMPDAAEEALAGHALGREILLDALLVHEARRLGGDADADPSESLDAHGDQIGESAARSRGMAPPTIFPLRLTP